MLLLQAVFIPIILAPIIYFIGLRIGKNVGWLTFLILFYCTSLLLYSGFSSPERLESYNWAPIGEFGLFLDGLSFPFAAIIYILSTVIAMYSIPYMVHKIK